MPKPAVILDIAGRTHQFESGLTTVWEVRGQPHLTAVEALQHGTQVARLFNVGRLATYLAGESLKCCEGDEEAALLVPQMREDVGWNAQLFRIELEQYPEPLMERYVRLSSRVLQISNVGVPDGWSRDFYR